ncbi:unnamed protein product [Rhizophagus irregularis]|nr:unnamed protein product [Rhizophagus irregularis]
MKAISLCQRERMFTLLQDGYSSRDFAFREKVSHVSVLRIKKKKEKTGHFDVVPRPGRLRILTERHDRNIAKLIKTGECSNAIQIQKKLISDENIIISPNTVQRSLRKQGLVSRYHNWTIEDWHKVVWSDESKFMIFGSDGREWCWRDPNLPLKPQHVKPTVKFGGGSIMIWGCMGAFGVGKYCKIDRRMDGELYREIL